MKVSIFVSNLAIGLSIKAHDQVIKGEGIWNKENSSLLMASSSSFSSLLLNVEGTKNPGMDLGHHLV